MGPCTWQLNINRPRALGAGPSSPLKPCLPIKHRLTLASRWQGSKAEIGTSTTSGPFISSPDIPGVACFFTIAKSTPCSGTRGSEKVYSDKLIMEIALCHPLLLTPCSIIFYLFRVFASSLKVPGDEALDWGVGEGEVPLCACLSSPRMPTSL